MGLADRTPPDQQEYHDYAERFSNWGRWGDDDELGTLNHITDERRLAAAALVRDGVTVSCSHPLATDPRPRNAWPVNHYVYKTATGSGDFIGIRYHGYANTHIDGLCHIFTPDGRMYNGRDASLVQSHGAEANSVDAWRDGIVTRGVLYDIPRLRGTDYVTIDAPVHGWELQDAAAAQGVEPRPGDAVLVRSGFEAFFADHPDFPHTTPPSTPGVHVSIVEFLYETDAALLGWDLMEAGDQLGIEARVPVHEIAIPYMGLPLLDNATFERLAEACAERGRWEFEFIVSPLYLRGGTGSPVNPIAIF